MNQHGHPAWAFQTPAREDIDAYEPPWCDFASFLASRSDSERTYLISVNEETNTRAEWTAAEWHALVHTVAEGLSSRHGVKAGDHIATLAGNSSEALAFAFGAWLLGACLVPLDPKENDARHQEILLQSGARLICVETEDDMAARARRHGSASTILFTGLLSDDGNRAPGRVTKRNPIPLNTPALRIYTSGTTGSPKAIVLTMRGILINCAAMQESFGWDRDTRVLTVLPIQHVNGLLINTFLAWYVGASTVLWDRFRSSTFWSVAKETRATTSSLVPTILEFLLAASSGSRPAHFLKEVISGSGPLRTETASEFERRFGVPVRQLYGLSETSAVLTVTPSEPTTTREPAFRGSVGPAVSHAEVDVVDQEGRSCPEGQPGEIVARGGMIMVGYANDKAANSVAFAGGWFHTGDRGYWKHGPDQNAWFFVEGRIRESILRGGLTIAPQRIDAIAQSHPRVVQAAAFPFPNRWYGEEVGLFVVADGDLTKSEILDWCAQRLDRNMRPKLVIFGNDMPVTRNGKLRRGELAARLSEQLAAYWDSSFHSGSETRKPQHERSTRNWAIADGDE
jgi:long-chain acyl-CoA synthetase